MRQGCAGAVIIYDPFDPYLYRQPLFYPSVTFGNWVKELLVLVLEAKGLYLSLGTKRVTNL